MSWFRDYVYIPLGGNQRSKLRTIINVFVVFLLSGMWHGANWTFIVWGLYHAALFLPTVLMGRKSQSDIVAKGRILPSLKEMGQMFFTFCLVLFGWILFRSESISDFVQYCEEMCQMGTLRACYRLFIQSDIWPKMVFIIIMLVVEWLQRDKEHGLVLDKMKPWLRWVICFMIVMMISCFTDNEIGSFIYFQF